MKRSVQIIFIIFSLFLHFELFGEGCSRSINCLAPMSYNDDSVSEAKEKWQKKNSKNVSIKMNDQFFNEGHWTTTITIAFDHDRPGLMYDVLEKVSPARGGQRRERGDLIWVDMIQKGEQTHLRISYETLTRDGGQLIFDRLKNVNDYLDVDHELFKNHGTYRCLLEIEIPKKKGSLKKLTQFLKNNYINIPYFHTPTSNGANRAIMVLEVEVPNTLDIETLRHEFETFINEFEGSQLNNFRIGTLIDRILDDFLLREIDFKIPISDGKGESVPFQDGYKTLIRQQLRKPLSVVSKTHLSEIRKDHSTPYVMHQVEIIKTLVNEFLMLDPEVIIKLSEQLNKGPIETINLILTATMLHDSLEDGDISLKRLKSNFPEEVVDIVLRLTKSKPSGTQEDENEYLNDLLNGSGVLSRISQIIKIADRLQSLRSLKGNNPVFQRKIFFKTWDHFVPEFLDLLENKTVEDSSLNDVMAMAKSIFMDELLEIGVAYGFLSRDGKVIQDQRRLYNKEKHIIHKIKEAGGSLSYADYMKEVLYGEMGYYTQEVEVERKKTPIDDLFEDITDENFEQKFIKQSKSFDTYAENPFFGHCIAEQVHEMWVKMGKPEKFQIVEMGAGRGSLAKNVIRTIKEKHPDLYQKLDYVIVELSPKLIQDQKKNISELFGSLDQVPIQWIHGSATEPIENLNEFEGVFLSNELPDAFPVHRLKKEGSELNEVFVSFKNGRFQEETRPPSTEEIKKYADDFNIELPDGAEIPVNINMMNWQKNMAKKLKRGFVLTIDYGGKAEAIAKTHPAAVWNRDTNDVQQMYQHTSLVDITSEVNFYDMAKWGRDFGLKTEAYTFQRDFLWNWEIDDIFIDGRYLTDRDSWDISTNFSFKVLAQSKGLDDEVKLKGFERSRDMFNYFYKQKVNFRLPLKWEEHQFIVVGDRFQRDIPKEVFGEGQKAVSKYLNDGTIGYSPYQRTQVMDVFSEAFVDDSGFIILPVSREDLIDLKIWDSEGNLIFDSNKLGENGPPSFEITYEDFAEECAKMIEVESETGPTIPNYLALTKRGTIEVVREVVTPKTFYLPYGINELGYFKYFDHAS